MKQGLGDQVMSAASRAASDSSYTVAALNIYLGLTVEQWCLVIGALCAFGTFLVNWWYRRRDSRIAAAIAQKEHGITVDD